jgi:hypothetical protein
MIDPISSSDQRTRFAVGVATLGGNQAAAAALGCSESTIRHIKAGLKPLHKGWLTDMARALLDKAEALRALERGINPLFHANLTQEQQG